MKSKLFPLLLNVEKELAYGHCMPYWGLQKRSCHTDLFPAYVPNACFSLSVGTMIAHLVAVFSNGVHTVHSNIEPNHEKLSNISAQADHLVHEAHDALER